MSLAGREVPPDQPIVGEACFAHHSGLHQAAMHLDPGCYEPFDPTEVGASRTECIGVHTGRTGLARALARLGLPSDPMGVAFLLPHVIRLARDRGRSLLDTRDPRPSSTTDRAQAERRRSWPSTNPPTTSSSATASASVERPREPATEGSPGARPASRGGTRRPRHRCPRLDDRLPEDVREGPAHGRVSPGGVVRPHGRSRPSTRCSTHSSAARTSLLCGLRDRSPAPAREREAPPGSTWMLAFLRDTWAGIRQIVS